MVILSFLVAVFIVLLIGYNIIVQYKQNIATNKQKVVNKLQKHTKILESLVDYSNELPFSQELMLCLQTRILENLRQIKDLDHNSNTLEKLTDYIATLERLILKNRTNYEPAILKLERPENEEKMNELIKSIKRIRGLLRNEHKRGHISADIYVKENKNLEALQLQINIDNIFKRVKEAKESSQFINAIQIVNKALEVLSTKNMPEAIMACNGLTTLKEELTTLLTHQDNERNARLQQRSERHVDASFEVKKKW